MKAMLATTAVAAAISFGVSHSAISQDRESQATRLFDISEQIQQSGPCRDLPFLWLTNENIIAFLDALTSGEYEDAGPKLPQYIACFEHQTEVVEIRSVIHAEFPETEAAFKIAEVGYFTGEDIDEFIALLKLSVRPAATDGTGVTPNARDDTLPPWINPVPGAMANSDALADRVQRTARRTAAEGRGSDEPERVKIPLHKPVEPGDVSEEAVAALLKDLEKEIEEAVNASRAANREPSEEAVAALLEDLGKEEEGAGLPASSGESAAQPGGQQAIQEASALLERARRIRERQGGTRFEDQRLAFAPARPETRRPSPIPLRPITPGLAESVRRDIQDCWVPSTALRDRQDLTVTIRFGLSPDGSLRNDPTVVEQSRLGSQEFRLAAETARRAVLECTPLEGLPEGSYEEWREVSLAFDPKDLPGHKATSREGGVLGAGDEVRVIVFGEEELSGEFKISGNGWISMPLIGGIAAAGRSADQLEASIVRALLDGHMKDPRVSIEVLTFESIFVLGEVNNPGSYPYSAGLTMLKVIALAGGYTTRAKKNALFLSRDPEQEERKITANERVLPGDTIRVKERWF